MRISNFIHIRSWAVCMGIIYLTVLHPDAKQRWSPPGAVSGQVKDPMEASSRLQTLLDRNGSDAHS